MSKARCHVTKTHRRLLDALKCGNIKTLNEVIEVCDKRVLNRKLRYEINGQQRLFSPILAAVDLSSKEAVKLLLSKGVDVNKKGFSSSLKEDTQYIYTPLFLACCMGRLDLIPLLVEAGADVDSDAGDKNVREEEDGYLHMEGVYPLLNFSLMYLSSAVSAVLLHVGADPSLSLMAIVKRGYHVSHCSIKTLLQAGALLNVEGFSVITFFIECNMMSWDILEIASSDFNPSHLNDLLRKHEEKLGDGQPSVESESRKILTGILPEMLQHCCRRQIRKMCGNIRLFYIINQLCLPNELKKFLLFGYESPSF